jgi:6-phosphofructokinase 1
MNKIGVLTSGGDSPGMNAAIRACVKTALHYGIEVVGIQNGYDGIINSNFTNMTYRDVENIIQFGGTVLGSARSKAFRTAEGRESAFKNLNNEDIEALVIIGGDGSFTGAEIFSKEFGVPFVGLPGTIDNDLYGTDSSIGYDTALNTIIEAVDKIRDTASSHHRIFFVEVMGRDSGFLALNSAIASGAESVLIPETITDIKALAEQIKTQNKGNRSSIIIVAEGDDAGGAVDIVRKVKPYLPDHELRTTVLGHTQRGGSPTYLDRAFATSAGVKAIELLMDGETNLMVGIEGKNLTTVPISAAISKKSIPDLDKEILLKKLLTR